MRTFLTAILMFLALVLPATAAKRIALVIGNNDYDHVIDLKNSGNDADLMERTLKDVGFEVLRYNDLDQRGMKQAMLDFGRKLKEGAEASMFYYAGHGVEIGGVNYLVPRDADLKSSEEADIQNVSVNSFLALTENSSRAAEYCDFGRLPQQSISLPSRDQFRWSCSCESAARNLCGLCHVSGCRGR